jgi:TRAP-type C4-dicarboxylate transport system substrate-binding protein
VIGFDQKLCGERDYPVSKEVVLKRLILVALAVIVTISLFIVGCSSTSSTTTSTSAQTSTSTSQAPVIKLSSALYLPTAHPFTALQEQWGKDIEAASNGRVQITYYPGGQLLGAPQTADGIVSDIADIAFAHIDYSPGRFPVTEFLDLPNGYATGWVGSHVAVDFYNQFKPKEWDNMHLLFLNAGTTAGLMLHDKKITKLEDLKGVTLRGAGAVGDTITALGATARDVPMTEMYDDVSKGVVDGALVGIETLKSFKMADVCKYTTFAWQAGSMYTFYLAMNLDKWNSMPADIQQIFTDVSKQYEEKYAEAWNSSDIAGIQYSLSIAGNEVFQLTDAEGQRWSDAVQSVLTDYSAKMAAAGDNKGPQYLSFIQDRITYWSAQEKQQGIKSPFDLNLPVAQ